MPNPTPDPTAVDELGTELQAGVARLYRRLIAERSVGQMSDSQHAALTLLVKQGPRTLRELSDHEHVTPPSMNLTINALERDGLVTRAAHPDDGRKITIAATAAGADVTAENRRRRHAWLNVRLQRLTDDERAALAEAARIMRTIADS